MSLVALPPPGNGTPTLPRPTWGAPVPGDPSSPTTPTPDPGGNPAGVSRSPSVLQESLAGSDSVVPLIYGRARIGGQISIATTYNGDLVLCVVWCMGEISSVTVKINDEAVPTGVTVTTYLGTTTQQADPTLVAAVSGYSDRLVYTDPAYGSIGIAYSVIRVPPDTEGISGFPRITGEIQGRKVFCCVANGYVYSENPALILADLISNPIIGMGRPVDYSSQTALQTVCNEVMADGAARRKLNLVLADPVDVVSAVETVRAYAGCMLFFDGDKAVFIPNRPTTNYVTVSADRIIKGSLVTNKSPVRPTAVTVSYTDTSSEPWRTYYATAAHPSATAGTLPWREESISMPGIMNHGQAYREALERLNFYRYSDKDIEFTMTDEGLRLTVGDVIAVTHQIGYSGTLFRVETISAASPGRWRVSASLYSASIYATTEAPTVPPVPNIQPPSSEDPEITDPPGATLTLTEVRTVLSDGTPVSRISATWTASTSPVLAGYSIQWKLSTFTGWSYDSSPTNSWMSPAVTPGTYTVEVRTRATDGAEGAALTGTISITGKTTTGWTPPSPPTGSGGSLYLIVNWAFPIDPETSSIAKDISHTQVWMASTNSYGSAQKIAEVKYPGTSYIVQGVPVNTCRFFWVRFVDTSGNVSATVPSGANSGIQLCTPNNAADYLPYLTDQIQESHLNSTLSTKITRASDDANQAIIEVGALSTEVYGEYYVKIDVDGRVAGFGLANDATTGSLFLVKADRFAVGSPGINGTFPFIVETNPSTGLPAVYMTSAYIKDLSVTNAKITNLTVGTEKAQRNAFSKAANYTIADMEFASYLSPTTYTHSGVIHINGAYVYSVLITIDFVFEQSNSLLDYQIPGPGYSITVSETGRLNGSHTWTAADNQFQSGPRTISRAYSVTNGDLDSTPTDMTFSFTFTSKKIDLVSQSAWMRKVKVAVYTWAK